MTRTTDTVALDDWQVVGPSARITAAAPCRTRLLGQDIVVERAADGSLRTVEIGNDGVRGAAHPARDLYGYVWTTLGDPPRDPLDMPEFEEAGRRFVDCGKVTVRTSPLRIVENFLDMSHFPYVHTGILGEEPLTEVSPYKVEVREPESEIWATDCRFYQPQAAKSATGGIDTQYMYRVSSPFVTVLYKTCPAVEGAWDLIGIYVQPREETVCDVHIFMLLLDDVSSDAELISFQHEIFQQDRSILENQVPALMPLDPGAEAGARADRTSTVYRRWLRDRGLRFGVHGAAA